MTEAALQEPTFAPEARPGGGEEAAPLDYFGFSRTDKFYMPGSNKRYWIEYRALNEGQKKAFQDKTSRDLVVERGGSARMSILQGSERHELIRSAIVDWNLMRGGSPIPCDKKQINDFLELADPVIVEELEKAIRKANPWLLAEMKSEDIQKEIDNLEEMLAEAKKREAGEAS